MNKSDTAHPRAPLSTRTTRFTPRATAQFHVLPLIDKKKKQRAPRQDKQNVTLHTYEYIWLSERSDQQTLMKGGRETEKHAEIEKIGERETKDRERKKRERYHE